MAQICSVCALWLCSEYLVPPVVHCGFFRPCEEKSRHDAITTTGWNIVFFPSSYLIGIPTR